MTQTEYDQKRNELWYEYNAMLRRNCASRYVFDKIFDRAYALGKQQASCGQVKEAISQEIEKAAIEYVLTRQQARHNAKKEEDATMRDFDKTIKAWDAYDMEQAFESGANLFLGKQEKNVNAVAQGWAARDKSGDLYIYTCKPERIINLGYWGGNVTDITPSNDLFPDLTWESDPLQVEIILKRKKNG